MKVLVTGGCGFLGTHVCEFYAKRGDDVIAYDNMTKYELERTGYATDAARNDNKNYLESLGVRIIKADIRDMDTLLESSKGCNYIIHTAAQPAMTISWEDPRLDFSTNVIGTFNVLETAREMKIPVASCATVHVYGNKINEELREEKTRYTRNPSAIDEQFPTLKGKISPLHASKGAGDIYVQTYIDTYGIEAASFRLTGIYGPRQFGGEDHGWVANFAIRAILGWPSNIYGTGKQVRDILFATDVCEAFQAFYEKRKSGIYNIGGGINNAISLIECINLIGEILEKKPETNFYESRFGDLQYFVCDIIKAERELGWKPKVSPEEGVKRLVDWITANKNLFEVKQIESINTGGRAR